MKPSISNSRLSFWILTAVAVFFTQTVRAQPFWPGAIATPNTVDLNGWSLIADSFDSSDPTYSTNGQYDPAKARDNGDVFVGAGINNTQNVGYARIYGHVHTLTHTNLLSLGLGGAIGSRSWQATHTGIEPGWWLQDTNITVTGIPFPDTSGYLIPTGGVLVTMSGNSYVTNFYNQILWGSPTSTNYYVTNSLSGQTIVVGPNVVLALPNGLLMSGSDTLTVADRNNLVDGPPQVPSLTVYAGGNTCTVGGNGVINQSGLASAFALFCAPSVTSVAINGNGAINGVVVAPNAQLDLNGAGTGTSDFIGYVAANSVRLNGNRNFHYDESLFGPASNPLIFDAITQMTNGWVGLDLSGQVGKNVTIYSSPDLLDWLPVATLPNPQGTVHFTDTTSPGVLSRFYKAVAY